MTDADDSLVALPLLADDPNNLSIDDLWMLCDDDLTSSVIANLRLPCHQPPFRNGCAGYARCTGAVSKQRYSFECVHCGVKWNQIKPSLLSDGDDRLLSAVEPSDNPGQHTSLFRIRMSSVLWEEECRVRSAPRPSAVQLPSVGSTGLSEAIPTT